MTTIATNGNVRINQSGTITVPWRVFVNVHPEDVMDVVRKKATLRTAHTIRPTTRVAGVKEFI